MVCVQRFYGGERGGDGMALDVEDALIGAKALAHAPERIDANVSIREGSSPARIEFGGE